MRKQFFLFGLFWLCLSCSEPTTLDLYIHNAVIIDGTGAPAYVGNIGISGDQIAYLSKEEFRGEALRTIDAEGRYISPGFIDPHAHGNPYRTPEFENFLAMGVTTIVLGQDGSGPIQELPEWQAYVDSTGTGVNIAALLGHGTLRQVSGKLSPSDYERMDELITLYGRYTFGLSTGLEYSPGLYADEEELKFLAERVPLVMSHMRNEDDSALLYSIDELASQGIYTRVHISHIKSVYGKGRERAEIILAHIDSLRRTGIQITADVYPYSASYTGISILFPEWSKTQDQFDEVREERAVELLGFLRRKIEKRNGPEATLFGTEPYTGKTLKEVSESYNMKPEDFLVDSVGPQGASAAYFVMNDELQERFIQDPMVAICSDGSPVGFHPRGHGTYARILEEFVRKRNTLTVEEAVRKMTSFPADILGIEGRGRLETGAFADLIMFDLQNIRETATSSNPLQLAEGFDLVIVNGKIAREGSVISRPGKFLLP